MAWYDTDGRCCHTCFNVNNLSFCNKVAKPDHSECYANATQTEALLKWHDERYLTIQERLKQEEESKKEKAVEDIDFRVDDPVTIFDSNVDFSCKNFRSLISESYVSCTNGINKGKPIEVPFQCTTLLFDRNGNGDSGVKLHHGHDLKVTVEEKNPVRWVVRWVFSWIKDTENPQSSILYKSEKDAKAAYIEISLGYHMITPVQKVQIPE